MATLSTLFLFQGITLLVDGGYNLKGSRDLPFTFIGQENILGIPAVVYVLVPVVLISAVLLKRTAFGRRLFAVGLSRKAAFAAGVNTSGVVVWAYTICGMASAVGGIVLISRLTMAQPAAGAPYLFDIVTAVILGGTSLSGGFGSIYKTVVGFVLLGVVNNGMALLGVPFEYQQMVKGMIFIMAVVYDEFMKRKRLS
jgi:ribose/xylose/arabinose/galactoside ABC-type transport system permease subunit